MKKKHLFRMLVIVTLGSLLFGSLAWAQNKETYPTLVQDRTQSPSGHIIVREAPGIKVPKDWDVRWFVSIYTPKGYKLSLGYIGDTVPLRIARSLIFEVPVGEHKIEITRKSEQWASGGIKGFDLDKGIWQYSWPETIKVDDVIVPVKKGDIKIVNISYENPQVVEKERKGREKITLYSWEQFHLSVEEGSSADLAQKEPALYSIVKQAAFEKIDQTHLVEALKKDDGYQAAIALLNCEKPNAQLIGRALADESLTLKFSVARILAKTSDKSAVRPLIGILKEGTETQRYIAAWTLGELKAREAVDTLIAALDDKSVMLRNHAAYALAQIKDQKAVDVLIEAVKDRDMLPGSLFVLSDPEMFIAYCFNSNKIVGPHFPTPSSEMRENAIYALGQIGGKKAVNALLSLIDQNDGNHIPIIFALSNHKDNRVINALIKELKSKHHASHWPAIQALGRMGEKASATLEDIAENGSTELVRKAAQEALEKIEKADEGSDKQVPSRMKPPLSVAKVILLRETKVIRLVMKKSSDITQTTYHYDGAFRTGSTTSPKFDYVPETHIKRTLEQAGFTVIPEDSDETEDATLSVNYQERKRGFGLNYPTAYYFSFTLDHKTEGRVVEGSSKPNGCDSIEELEQDPQFKNLGSMINAGLDRPEVLAARDVDTAQTAQKADTGNGSAIRITSDSTSETVQPTEGHSQVADSDSRMQAQDEAMLEQESAEDKGVQDTPKRIVTGVSAAEKAATDEQKYAAEKERSFRSHRAAGSDHQAREEWEEAIEAYIRALAFKPGDVEARDRLATCRHNLCLSQAQEAESKNDLDTAIRLYTKAISHKQIPSTQARLDSARKALQERAESERRQREYAKWLKLAETAEKDGSPTTAIQLYKEAQAVAVTQDYASLQAKIDSLMQQIADKQAVEERAKILVDYGSLNHRLDMNLKGRGWVQDVCFSHAGDKIASTDRGTIRIWNASTGICSRILKGHTNEVELVCFSRDDKLVASGDARDKVIKIWDFFTGQCQRTIQTGHRKDLLDLSFSPDGKFIVSASDDKTLKLWDIEKGHSVRTFLGHGAGIFCVDFAPDGRWIASGSWDKTIRIWNVQSGELLKIMAGHKSTIESLAFSPDGVYIAACEYWGNKVIVWDVEAAQPVVKKDLNSALCVAFSPTGDYVAIGDAYGQVNILNVKNGEWVKKFKSHKGFLGVVRINAVAFSPDGKYVIVGADNQSARVFLFE